MKLNHTAPYLPDPCADLGSVVRCGIVDRDSDWLCICETDLDDGELADTIAYAHPDNAPAIAAALTACHGLDIPEGVPPGALAELVARLRKVLSFGVTCTSGLDDEEFYPALDSLLDALDPFKTD